MLSKKITSAGPSITQAEIDLVTKAVTDGWQEKMSYYIDAFSEEFSSYVGLDFCLPTSHCTDAIHLAMVAMDLGPGDEVIVPDLTWVASVSPLVHMGVKPVFADVDLFTWCLSAETIERCITPKTKAVVVVDLLGNLPNWSEILDLCQKRGIRIIEDAAEGLGATYENKQAGNFGEVSLFSFNATKLIMSGQGGALCTNNADLYKKAKLISHHGIDKQVSGKYYWSNVIGFNYNWTNIQAALALAQLRRIDQLLSYKKWLFEGYKKRLSIFEDLALNSAGKSVNPSYWITTAIIGNKYRKTKEELIEDFSLHNIDMRPMFYPLSSMPPFKKYSNGEDMAIKNPNSYYLSKHGICLPNGNNLSEEDIENICNAFNAILN